MSKILQQNSSANPFREDFFSFFGSKKLTCIAQIVTPHRRSRINHNSEDKRTKTDRAFKSLKSLKTTVMKGSASTISNKLSINTLNTQHPSSSPWLSFFFIEKSKN
jgi:hypothetical protein